MLTREYVMSLQAGPEADALIAEMMGYTRIDEPDTFWLIERAWTNLDEPVYWMTERWGVKVADRNGHRTFNPTRNIADAWQVVEKLQAEYHWVIKSPFGIGDQWVAGLTPLGFTGWNGRPDFGAAAPTAPLAICRASLLCVSGK